MRSLPQDEIVVYRNADALPPEAEEMFAGQRADSRHPLPEDWWDRDQWGFALTCAMTSGGHVLGGVYLDIGPIGGEGPLAKRKPAYLERTLVRPEYRRCGLATRLLREAIRIGLVGPRTRAIVPSVWSLGLWWTFVRMERSSALRFWHPTNSPWPCSTGCFETSVSQS